MKKVYHNVALWVEKGIKITCRSVCPVCKRKKVSPMSDRRCVLISGHTSRWHECKRHHYW